MTLSLLCGAARSRAADLSDGISVGALLSFLDVVDRAASFPMVEQVQQGEREYIAHVLRHLCPIRARTIELLGDGSILEQLDVRAGAFIGDGDSEQDDSILYWADDVLTIAGALPWLGNRYRCSDAAHGVVRRACDVMSLWPAVFSPLAVFAADRAECEPVEGMGPVVEYVLEVMSSLPILRREEAAELKAEGIEKYLHIYTQEKK